MICLCQERELAQNQNFCTTVDQTLIFLLKKTKHKKQPYNKVVLLASPSKYFPQLLNPCFYRYLYKPGEGVGGVSPISPIIPIYSNTVYL